MTEKEALFARNDAVLFIKIKSKYLVEQLNNKMQIWNKPLWKHIKWFLGKQNNTYIFRKQSSNTKVLN